MAVRKLAASDGDLTVACEVLGENIMVATGTLLPTSVQATPDIARIVRQSIERRFGQTIGELAVYLEANQIVVRGRADSYYHWQCVLSACRQILALHSGIGLDCAMSVPNVNAADN